MGSVLAPTPIGEYNTDVSYATFSLALSCYVTACRPSTSSTDDVYPILNISVFKLPPPGTYLPVPRVTKQ